MKGTGARGSTLKERLRQQLQDQDLQPQPKWHFIALRSVVWIGVCLNAALCGFALGVLFLLNRDAFDLADQAAPISLVLDRSFEFLLFWSGLLGVTGGAALLLFRHTRWGYRPSRIALLCLGAGVVSLLAAASEFSGLSQNVDATLNENIRAYPSWQKAKRSIWTHPEEGRLSGRILSTQAQERMVLEDWNGRVWDIDLTSAHIRSRVRLEPQELVKVIGRLDHDTFVGTEVRPWKGRHGRGNAKGWRPQAPHH